MHEVTAIILGGGRGERLMPLTRDRAKPSVGFAGKYRLIDIPISNCIHSDIKRIFVLTQFLSASLHRHIMQTYQFDSFTEGFVDILAAEQSPGRSDWFQGTADAVRATLAHTMYYPSRQMLILSGDQLYRMNYSEMLRAHRRGRADITMAVTAVDRAAAPGLGILHTDESGRVVAFHEKPSDPDLLDIFAASPDFLRRHNIPFDGPRYLASMGIYIFQTRVLCELLQDTAHQDFGGHVIPAALERYRLRAHPFAGYWRDIGTIRSFYEANISLTCPDPPFSLYAPNWPIYSRSRSLPPNRIVHSEIRDSLIVEGSNIVGAHIVNSVIGVRSSIREGSRLSNTVMLGADYYYDEDTPGPATAGDRDGPQVGVGRDCEIDCAIIDKDARIGNGVRIQAHDASVNIQNDTYWVRDGITIVPKGAIIADGTVI